MKVLLVACLFLAACTGDAEPEAREAPATTAPPDYPCPNQEAVIEDESLRSGKHLPGDVDGDGAPDTVAIYFDRTAPGGCQAFVVAELYDGEVVSGPLETWRAEFGLPMPTLHALKDVDADYTPDVVVNMGMGASTQFVGIVKYHDGVLEQVTVKGPGGVSVAEGMFGFGGSVGHLEGIDCSADPNVIVAAFATPHGDAYEVVWTYFAFDGTELVRQSKQVERVPAARIGRLSAFANPPFGGCR